MKCVRVRNDIGTESHFNRVDRGNALDTCADFVCSKQIYSIHQNINLPLTQGTLTPLQRTLGVALVTAEVHNRDVLSELVKEELKDAQNFLWQAQLRWVCCQGYVGSRILLRCDSLIAFQYGRMNSEGVHIRLNNYCNVVELPGPL